MTNDPHAASIRDRRGELFSGLKKLYQDQIARGTIDYIEHHSNNDVIIMGQVDAFIKYYPYLRGGNILDWGCLHGPDSCLLRIAAGEANTLYGCDVYPSTGLEVFREFTRARFSFLEHPYRLPFEDGLFDTVIGSGVIEHVVNPRESLKEIYRVLKPDGTLVLTYAPSWHSFTEWVLRLLKHPHHRRRFTVHSLHQLLLDSGFVAETIQFHAVTPTLSSPRFHQMRGSSFAQQVVSFLYRFNPLLEKFYPLNRLGQNIMVCARRVPQV